MKKVLLLLVAGSFLLNSCDTTPPNIINPEDQRAVWGEVMTVAATNQLSFVLDPFNLAFRLNALMTECEMAGLDIWDVNNPTIVSTRNALFGNNLITYDDSNQQFTLTLATGAAGDYTRSGKLQINTNGRLLKEDGAFWSLSLPSENQYILSSVTGFLISLSAGSYTVAVSAENSWNINVYEFMAKTSDEYEAWWSGNLVMTQDDYPGDQSVAKISTSTYSCVVLSNPDVGALDTPEDKYQMLTTEGKPLRFNANCENMVIVGGELKVIFTEIISEYPMAYTLANWGTGSSCDAKVTAMYYGPI